MIEQQIRPWNVLDSGVLELLSIVKREDYVPPAYKNLAFVDTEIPLGNMANGECMLAPKIEARIMQAVNVRKHETVLEVGAGSGYMAALLAHKARFVTTVEINPTLKDMAEKNLAKNSVRNVAVVLGNGAQGWAGSGSQGMPYDVIVISASLPVVPAELLQQLKVGGRLAVIVGDAPAMSAQVITRASENGFNTEKLFETNTSPLLMATTPSNFSF